MKFSHTVAAILVSFLISPDLTAGTIYKWTDKNGVEHITNLPPPEEVKVQERINYKERTAKERQEYQNIQEKEREESLKQQREQEAQEAKIRAEKAAKEAQEAKVGAEQATQKAQEYTEKYGLWKKDAKDAFRKRSRMLIKEAKEAEARANEAVAKANQAEKEAIEAAKEAQEIEGQNR